MAKMGWPEFVGEVRALLPKKDGKPVVKDQDIDQVLRAFAVVVGPEQDPDCEVINQFHGLDPEDT